MLEFYPAIRNVHIGCVIASGLLFAVRGSLMWANIPGYNHLGLRALSWSIDTTLLTAALMLATTLHQYPFVHAWLTVKVVLLIVYVGLGTVALKSNGSGRSRRASFVLALCVYLAVISVARAHHPLGALHSLLS